MSAGVPSNEHLSDPRDADSTGQIENFDAALARSRETGHPLFLYWGTKWCPPCAEMQVTVLQRPQFRSRSAHMVSLAIDGDAPGAQACGERVDVTVYPSMLMLDHEEREWIRLPCGLEEDVFCSVVDAALRKRVPMRSLVDALDGADRECDADGLTLLAFHYWPQERRIRPGAARLGLLETLDAAVLRRRPDLSARVLIWHLIERAGRPGAETPFSRRHRLYDRLMAFLDSGKATFSTMYYLLVGLDPVAGFLCEEDDGRRGALNQALHDFSEGLVGDRTLSWTERLIAQAATLKLASTDWPQLVERTRALVMSADAETPGPVERQSVMNMAGHLLRQCGLVEDSIDLFCREIERSPWPTYFMPYVAEMRMERGEREEALRWWRRAYEETPGKNTRFELGVRCVEALVRHAAAERGAIESLVTRLLAERGDDADATRGRMRRSFGQLARTLADWRP